MWTDINIRCLIDQKKIYIYKVFDLKETLATSRRE